MNEGPRRNLSLSELASAAQVSPRTIRYYIAEGLLRSPGSGPQARYDESHVKRIRVIKQLQKSHLPLAEIRNRLRPLSDEEVGGLVEERQASIADTSALDYVRTALSSRAAPPPQMSVAEASFASAAGPMPNLPTQAQSPAPDRSHWERISLDPDIELHIRRPLTRQHNRAVSRIIGTAREILEEETR